MEAICLRRQIATCSEADSWQKFPATLDFGFEYKSCNWKPQRNGERVPWRHSPRVRNTRPLWALTQGHVLPSQRWDSGNNLPGINPLPPGRDLCTTDLAVSCSTQLCRYTQTRLKPELRKWTPERLDKLGMFSLLSQHYSKNLAVASHLISYQAPTEALLSSPEDAGRCQPPPHTKALPCKSLSLDTSRGCKEHFRKYRVWLHKNLLDDTVEQFFYLAMVISKW